MKRSFLLMIGFIILAVTACEYKYIEPVVIELPPDEVISFAEQVEPIFQGKCIGCHASTNPILTTGNAYSSLTNGNYVDTVAPTSSPIYVKVNEGHPGGSNVFNATELAILLEWIQEGAQNN